MVDELVEQVCTHELCSCVLEEGELYCSLYCEEADEAEAIANRCGCGHGDCVPESP